MSQEHDATVEHKPHVLPIRVYAGVWIGLLILSLITVRVSYLDFGVMNLVVAMVIATVKAGLVVLFFMHLKYDEGFNVIVFLSSLAFLGIFLVFTLADTMERGRIDPIEADVIQPVPGRPDLPANREHGKTGGVEGADAGAEAGAGVGVGAEAGAEAGAAHDGAGDAAGTESKGESGP